jgi:type I restriction enzyme, S subunit
MKYQTYTQYVGDLANEQIPAHWKKLALKRIVSVPITDGPHETPEFADEGVPFVSAESVWGGSIHLESMRGFISRDVNALYSKKYCPQREDVLIVKSGSTTGKIAFVDFDTIFNVWSPLAAVRCSRKKAIPRFVFYSLTSGYFQDLIRTSWSFGTQPNIGMAVIENLPVILPSIPEQEQIVQFLDRKSEEIDALVNKKYVLIERLREKRSALISYTVTHGLPPEAARAVGLVANPKLKQTGVDWIGLIPEHWQVRSFLRLAQSIQTGPFGSQLHESDFIDSGIPLINPAHIIDGSIQPDEHSTVDQATAKRLSRHKLKAGDIIMGRRGEIGRCAVITEQEQGWLCGTGSLRIRLYDSEPRYFSRIIGSTGFSTLLELNAVGTTMLNLNTTIIGRMQVPVPPRPEQLAIARFLDAEMLKIDSLIAKIERAVERLQEYRTALVTAAVTGKIDVHNACQTIEELQIEVSGICQ